MGCNSTGPDEIATVLRELSMACVSPHCRGQGMNKSVTDIPHPKMLLDPYAAWAAKEGVPITEDFGVDLLQVATAPWPRFDVDGGLVHLKGRGDFVSIFVLNLFHNESFVFDNDYDFPERQGAAKYFSGEGEFIPVRPGRNMWETNFIPDLAGFELKTWEQRGAGGSNMMFILADGTMHAHTSQMPVGTYKKAHRHGADFHVFAVTGHGFSLLWYEG